MRQFPAESLAAIAQRSASGSFAITKSAFSLVASFIAKSMAPGSSGFGKATVGKSGFGSDCSLTNIGRENFALSNTDNKVLVPTPCMAV